MTTAARRIAGPVPVIDSDHNQYRAELWLLDGGAGIELRIFDPDGALELDQLVGADLAKCLDTQYVEQLARLALDVHEQAYLDGYRDGQGQREAELVRAFQRTFQRFTGMDRLITAVEQLKRTS